VLLAGLQRQAQPEDLQMSGAGRRRVRAIALGWALLYAREGNDWSAVDRGPYDPHCGRLLAGKVDAETLDRIGTVLAAQPADNPLRQDAYRRAARHVAARYRCVYGVR
jgi:hypothetical protein